MVTANVIISVEQSMNKNPFAVWNRSGRRVARHVVKWCDTRTWRSNVFIIPWNAAGSMSFGFPGNFGKPLTEQIQLNRYQAQLRMEAAPDRFPLGHGKNGPKNIWMEKKRTVLAIIVHAEQDGQFNYNCKWTNYKCRNLYQKEKKSMNGILRFAAVCGDGPVSTLF